MEGRENAGEGAQAQGTEGQNARSKDFQLLTGNH